MEEFLRQVKGDLSLIVKKYDIINIVDPINKHLKVIKDNRIINTDGTCYGRLKKSSACSNCISMRAYRNRNTFFKIEYIDDKIVMIIATPIFIDDEIIIIEILKDISRSENLPYDLRGNRNSNNLSSVIEEMNDKIIKDELTGIYNRIYIDERLPVDVNNSIIIGSPLSVIIIAVHFLEEVNDKYGHVYEDKIIRDFAGIIGNSIKIDTDWVGRYSQNEFLVVLNNTDKQNASNVLMEIKRSLSKATFQSSSMSIKIAASFSIYCIEGEKKNAESILTEINKKLYETKNRFAKTSVIDDYIELHTCRFSSLDNRIQELRDALNEMCISSDEIALDNQKLCLSQALDELIVEYMRNIDE